MKKFKIYERVIEYSSFKDLQEACEKFLDRKDIEVSQTNFEFSPNWKDNFVIFEYKGNRYYATAQIPFTNGKVDSPCIQITSMKSGFISFNKEEAV